MTDLSADEGLQGRKGGSRSGNISTPKNIFLGLGSEQTRQKISDLHSLSFVVKYWLVAIGPDQTASLVVG